MNAAAAGGRDAVHKQLHTILRALGTNGRRAKLAELSGELSGESMEMFQFSDRALVASVIRQEGNDI